MISVKSSGALTGAGIFAAFAASLCCITPVIALLAGSSSIAANFSWIEPARPYLIALTIVVLGFAWYLKLKPKVTDDCGCAIEEKQKFIQSKTFLLIVTAFATLMLTFPLYAKVFFPKKEKTQIFVEKSNIKTAVLKIKGMSCEACEAEVNLEVNKLSGIVQSAVSYKDGNAVIQFDSSKTTIKEITDAVNATGYKVIDQSFKN